MLSTFSKFDEKNHFFAKNIFVATDGKTAIYQKKKTSRFVITPPGPSRKHEDLIHTFLGIVLPWISALFFVLSR
jgi:hypothetical protein